ncbi:hypothetical protein WS105_0632 [Weissella ceti]|nr:hypothetical protein [Weissella ceti]AIM64222.1 hypothetical protein WS105_0632 [Weissella ceti]
MKIEVTDEQVEKLAELYMTDIEKFKQFSAQIMERGIFNADNF